MKYRFHHALALVLGGTLASGLSLFAASPVLVIEDFRGDPAGRGWQVAGDPGLFAWNATNQNLEVTWDSSRPNSYFHHPLGRTLTRADSFHFDFELRLDEIAIGTTPGKPFTFQIAAGLLNLGQATNSSFLRGTGFDSPNLFEFDYFPDSGFGATLAPTVISSNSQFATRFIVQELTTGDLFRVQMRYDPDDEEVQFSVTRNGEPYAAQTFPLGMDFTDFSVDAFAVMSYSDAGQMPEFAGSILARGVMDNVYFAVGRQPSLDIALRGGFENGNWRIEFNTMAGWTYDVFRTADFVASHFVGRYTSTNSERASVTHTNPPLAQPQFYRVTAFRP